MSFDVNNLVLLYFFAAVILLSLALFFHATYRPEDHQKKK